jgi:hypothetical protein
MAMIVTLTVLYKPVFLQMIRKKIFNINGGYNV